MKAGLFIPALFAFSVGACSDEPAYEEDENGAVVLAPTPEKHQLVNSLVDSFDVPSCLDAQLLYAGRKNGVGSVLHERKYDATDQCVNDLMIAAELLGFTESGPNVWIRANPVGTPERIRILKGSDLPTGNLVWEVDVE